MVETRLTAGDGRTDDADVVYLDPSSWTRVNLEVSIISIVPSLGRGARLDEVDVQLRAREEEEEEERNIIIVRRLLHEAGKKTRFSPPLHASQWSYGTLKNDLPQRSLRQSEEHR